jgi:amidohydrolase
MVGVVMRAIFRILMSLVLALGFTTLGFADDLRESDSRLDPDHARVDARKNAPNHALIDEWVDRELPGLLKVYRHLHANPELSLEEEKTSALVAQTLRAAGYAVESGIGGYGVVGVLENGRGPTLLLRGDMDGLPVTEATGLPYASIVRTKDSEGVVVGVMHACGHDVHVTNLLGSARLLSEMREAWRGTLVVLAQPAEELGLGAMRMIEDGLFERIPKPDYAIALHVAADLPAGSIGYVSGWAAANVDAVSIKIHGRGGHGARPHETVDPIVVSAHLVTALQTIVSRRIDPAEAAVVTVGSIHGGTKRNVIPDEVQLELTVRSYSEETREKLLHSIGHIAKETCDLFGCPKPPEVSIKEHYTPAMWNDPDLVNHGVGVFRSLLGEERVREITATMTGEDFGRYTRAGKFPSFLYRLGSVSESKMEARRKDGDPLPSIHSSRYAPDPKNTIRTGLRSMTRLALSLFDPPLDRSDAVE